MRRILALLLCLFVAVDHARAIGVAEAVAEAASTTDGTSYAMGAFTPSANAVLFVFVHAASTVDASTMSGGSLGWVKLASVASNSGTDTSYLWYAPTGGSPGSTTITFGCPGDGATGAIMMAWEATGANTTNPVKQWVATAFTATSNPTATLASSMDTTNAYISAFGMHNANPPGATVPTSWTGIADTGHGSPAKGAQGAYRVNGETGTTIAWSHASATYGIIAVEICDAANCNSSGLPLYLQVIEGSEHYESVPGGY